MVSIRCKMIVKQELDKLGIEYGIVDLGEVDTKHTLEPELHEKLRVALLKSGLELMDDKKAVLIEKVKMVVIEMIHYNDDLPLIKNSEYISEKLNHNYILLSSFFSEATGINIEQYIIAHKIEKAKELIIYGELNLTEISYMLGYKSVSHLSNQFKKVTGLTPTFFKHVKEKRRNTINNAE